MELSRIERIEDSLLQAISRVVWRRPQRRIIKMFEFSFTEEDSFRDMARAAELTRTPDMRGKYMLHALDEARHADLFRHRSAAIIKHLEAQGIDTRATRETMEALRSGAVSLHETYHHNNLFESLGELEFLAFVYVAERRGAQQFRIYRNLLKDDPESQAMFGVILNEEKFHMSYSRAALDKMARDGRALEVRWAIFRVRARRYWQAWLRFCRRFANVSNGILFTLLYVLLVTPTALFSRKPGQATGWQRPSLNPAPDFSSVQRQY
jgi:hypothetical protein